MADVAAGFCGALLLYAAAAKLDVFATFVRSLSWFASHAPARILAVFIVIIEAALGLGLLVPASHPWSALAGAALLAAFGTAIAYAAVARPQAVCMCFGGHARPITATHVARDAGLVLLLVGTASQPRLGNAALEVTGVGLFVLLLLALALRTMSHPRRHIV